jgi:hypothetical protein
METRASVLELLHQRALVTQMQIRMLVQMQHIMERQIKIITDIE